MQSKGKHMRMLRERRSWAMFLPVLWLGVFLGPAPVEASPFAYVTHFSTSDTVSVIDTATNTVVATVPVGNVSFGVAIAPAPAPPPPPLRMQIPTLSEWVMILLAACLALVGVAALRRRTV